ncbi:hypothetical protein; putative membrane protein [Cupriavidus taiwanensis LMG 19424]|uniref:Uncharacterized protein n=1 Tax=Cupriavidus taiwanensis (strain DSM 17343 / BCRC 17206 / CCUG 44338 / CIP 107171 / LMG 19424 / R1) TaxID=977880 RepID=B3R9I6_CUPTR|nr:hypothetical protein; putative membrane protein [Cupriavidus taiwanensis LMG 19424]
MSNFGAAIAGASFVLLFGFAAQFFAGDRERFVPMLLGAWGAGIVVACAAFGWRWIYAKVTMDQVDLMMMGGLKTPGALVAAACGGIIGIIAHVFMMRRA